MNHSIMSNKLTCFLFLTSLLFIFACSKDKDTGFSKPEDSPCNVQRVYRDGELIRDIEELSSTLVKLTGYNSDTISSEYTYEKYSDGRDKKRTFDTKGGTIFIDEYKYIGEDEFPDTIRSSRISNGITEFTDYTLIFYNEGACHISRSEYYDASGVLLSYTEYNYTDDNCSYNGKSYSIVDGLEELSREFEYNYDSQNNPYLSYLLPFSNTHNIINSENTYSTSGETYSRTYTYEYNEQGYPTARTITLTLGSTGETTETEYTYSYLCD